MRIPLHFQRKDARAQGRKDLHVFAPLRICVFALISSQFYQEATP